MQIGPDFSAISTNNVKNKKQIKGKTFALLRHEKPDSFQNNSKSNQPSFSGAPEVLSAIPKLVYVALAVAVAVPTVIAFDNFFSPRAEKNIIKKAKHIKKLKKMKKPDIQSVIKKTKNIV